MRRELANLTSPMCGLALGACLCIPSMASAQTGSLVPLPSVNLAPDVPVVAPHVVPVTPDARLIESMRAQTGGDETPALTVPSFGGIFAASGNDFKALMGTRNFMILGAGLGIAGLVSPADHRAVSTLSKSAWAEETFGAAELAGSFPLHIAAGFATYGIGRASASPRVAQFGADLVRAQFLSQGTAQVIKFAVGRTRPDGTDRSFPSGHSASMFATATVVQKHFGWKAGVPAYAAAAYVAAGRMQTERHFLSDVAFGAVIGIVSGHTVTVGRGRARFELAPAAMPGGAGVTATLLRH